MAKENRARSFVPRIPSSVARGRKEYGNMAKTANLAKARETKNDEFYTQWADIQKEINAYLEFNPDTFRGKSVLLPCDDPEWSAFTKFFAQNFEAFGLKKLVSTSYAFASKRFAGRGKTGMAWQPTLFEEESPQYDSAKSPALGKIFVLDHDTNANGRIDIEDLQWSYLEGDGDFRSPEVQRLRNEADIIITNPPFSLFREFVGWLMDSGKQFLIIGSMNAISYKEVFPLLQANKLWLGATGNGTDMVFGVPDGAVVAESDREKAAKMGYVGNYTRLGNSCWFTNLDHGRRHRPLELMTWAENVKHSRHKEIRGKGYDRYDNFDAIEVPYTDAIPGDYEGTMGVPVSFLDKHCPEQFEIVGITQSWFGAACKKYPRQIQVDKSGQRREVTKLNDGAAMKLSGPLEGETCYEVDGEWYAKVYARILIRRKHA